MHKQTYEQHKITAQIQSLVITVVIKEEPYPTMLKKLQNISCNMKTLQISNKYGSKIQGQITNNHVTGSVQIHGIYVRSSDSKRSNRGTLHRCVVIKT